MSSLEDKQRVQIKVSPHIREQLEALRWPRATYDDIIGLLIADFVAEPGSLPLRDLRNLALHYWRAKQDRIV